MGAQLAVIRVIDRDDRINAGVARGLKLGKLQLALVGRQRTKTDALQACGRYSEIDQLHARHRI